MLISGHCDKSLKEIKRNKSIKDQLSNLNLAKLIYFHKI